jgi:hypothetical protein
MWFKSTILIVLFLVAGSTALDADSRIIKDDWPEIALGSVLGGIGYDYDYNFTIEDAWTESEPHRLLETYLAERPFRGEGFQRELDHLRSQFPNLDFRVNALNPRIVHVLDARLRNQSNYGLEGMVKNLDFAGSLKELIAHLGRQGAPISSPRLIDIHEGYGIDFGTLIEAKGRNLSVRDALSLFVPLKERRRVLWIARTKLGLSEVSYVYFHKASNRNKN